MMRKKKASFYSTRPPQPPINRAIRYLSIRPRSIKEVFEYLKKWEYSEDEINITLEKLIEMKFLDDKEFARIFTRSRQIKGKSKKMIGYELKNKGIEGEISEDTLNDAQGDFKTAWEYIEKRSHLFQKMDLAERQRKITNRLRMRGYNWDIISRILKKI